jgi:hypothetical protein
VTAAGDGPNIRAISVTGWYVRLSPMTTGPSADVPSEFYGVLFREFFIGRFSIGGDGPWMMTSSSPLTYATLQLGSVRFTVNILASALQAALSFNPFASGGSWSYHEVERVERFEPPLWARRTRRRGVPPDRLPLGIRFHFGESRSALLFFTTESEALVTALEFHHVSVERTPIKLSPFLFGRR